MGLVLGAHIFLFWCLSYVPQHPLAIPKPPIPVQLVLITPTPEPEPEPIPAPPIQKPPKTAPPPVELKPEPEPEPEPPVAVIIMEPNPAPPSPLPAPSQIPKRGEAIPDKWRLPVGANIALDKTQQPDTPQWSALTQSLDCLGFDAACATQRKSIFAEDQLSGTDLVWMASHPHSGLSNSDLYGLSEGQIRKRLGITSAGENGFMLLPGIVIDGPWWDALHGVNKACDYGLGLDENGQKQLVKKCKPLKPSSKDRIGFIPKPLE